MEIIPAHFGKSWQIVCRQSSGKLFACVIAGSQCWQSSCRQILAGVFFSDLHYTFWRQNGVCHNTEAGGKVVGKRLAISSCTGIAGKVLTKLPPEVASICVYPTQCCMKDWVCCWHDAVQHHGAESCSTVYRSMVMYSSTARGIPYLLTGRQVYSPKLTLLNIRY